MMWLKAWWECRFRVALTALSCGSLALGALAIMNEAARSGKPVAAFSDLCFVALAGAVVPLITLLLAGSGINSQTSWGMLQGFHPSMYFLLSMPVSRRRALLVRWAVGAMLTLLFIIVLAGAMGMMAAFHGVPVTLASLAWSVFFLSAGGWGYFGLSTFLSTLFDEFWGGIIGLMVTGFVFGFAMSTESRTFGFLSFLAGLHYNRTGEVVWPALAAVLVSGAAFLAASVYVVERKEY